MPATSHPSAAAVATARRLAGGTAHADVRASAAFPDFVARAIPVWGGGDGEDAAFARTLRDMGRFAAGVWAIYLHGTPGGLTLTRLSALLDETGMAGLGRARAMLIFLQFVGYIEPAPRAVPSREKPFRPTDRLTRAVGDRLRREIGIYGLEGEAVAGCIERIGEADFNRRLTLAYAEMTIAMVQNVPEDALTIAVISHRYAGMSVLCHIIEAGMEQCGCFPPTRPVRFSMSEIAARNGISRTQLRHIFNAGAGVGFFDNPGSGEVTLTPLLIEHFELLIAGTYLLANFAVSQAISTDVTESVA